MSVLTIPILVHSVAIYTSLRLSECERRRRFMWTFRTTY